MSGREEGKGEEGEKKRSTGHGLILMMRMGDDVSSAQPSLLAPSLSSLFSSFPSFPLSFLWMLKDITLLLL